MNSSPESSGSLDEIVFVPLNDESSSSSTPSSPLPNRNSSSSPSSPRTSSRRKPKHPQKLSSPLSSLVSSSPTSSSSPQRPNIQSPSVDADSSATEHRTSPGDASNVHQPPPAKIQRQNSNNRKSSSSGYSSSSSAESKYLTESHEDAGVVLGRRVKKSSAIRNLYFGENSTMSDSANEKGGEMFCQVEEEEEERSNRRSIGERRKNIDARKKIGRDFVGEKERKNSSCDDDDNEEEDGVLSYNELTADIAAANAIADSASPIRYNDEDNESATTLTDSPITPARRHDDKISGNGHELIVPAPSGDGFYILATTSQQPQPQPQQQQQQQSDVVIKKEVDAEGGDAFSIYDNMPLDDDDEDDISICTPTTATTTMTKGQRFYVPASLSTSSSFTTKSLSSLSSSSAACAPVGKLKILTMEMKSEPMEESGNVGTNNVGTSRVGKMMGKKTSGVIEGQLRVLPRLTYGERFRSRLAETAAGTLDDAGRYQPAVSVASGFSGATTAFLLVKTENGFSLSRQAMEDGFSLSRQAMEENEENDGSEDVSFVEDDEMEEEDEASFHRKYALVPCEQCDRVFDDVARMRRHLKLVHGPKSFTCPECNKSFTQYGHMQVHLRSVHTSAKPFECAVCKRRFNISSNRNRHQRLHYTKGSLHFVAESEEARTYAKDGKHNASSDSDASSDLVTERKIISIALGKE